MTRDLSPGHAYIYFAQRIRISSEVLRGVTYYSTSSLIRQSPFSILRSRQKCNTAIALNQSLAGRSSAFEHGIRWVRFHDHYQHFFIR